MILRAISVVASGRILLARALGLHWLRIGPVGLAVPAGMALVVWNSMDRLGQNLGGVPFWILWPGLTAAMVAVWTLLPGRPLDQRSRGGGAGSTDGLGLPGFALVAQVLALWVLCDVQIWQQTNHLYDLNVYLGSAGRWMDGGQPYLTAPITSWPATASSDFFLYPPPLLPVFGLLSRLPLGAVAVGWTALMLACGYASFRILGLTTRLSLLLLAFPPLMIGVESGNVANLTVLLFVAGMRYGGALVVDGLFKVQTGLPALALIRGRRWRAVLAGAVALTVIVAATLPLTGLDAWRDWIAGLGYRAASQPSIVSLYGYSMAREVPGWLYGVICVAFVVFALTFRGRRGLAALGLASIFASPALWPHGFVFALPAVLMLESGTAVWAVLGAGAIGANMWLLFYAGWASVIAARRDPAGNLHPLAGTDGPWPRPQFPTARRTTPGPMTRARARGPIGQPADAMAPNRAE